ncbi:rod shape-determining protein RodA [Algicola sagamiensis]|uniref:rod shape-determining protein RodA n=1 Tax=Algicola sagamiensis TaxID=163869 RepID=UPI000376C31C|nr:rod shape-determining protein RodA [Algicola sagamiensis]
MHYPDKKKTPADWLSTFHIDWPLMLALLSLMSISLVVVYSASGQDMGLMNRQAVRLGVALFVCFAVAQIPPLVYRRLSVPVYLISIMLLVAVLVVGHVGKGAQRWLDIGFIKFQPSEILKMVLPMTVAWYISRQPMPPRLIHIAAGFAITLVPTLLIFKQPDFGTSLLIASSGIFVLFLAGMSWRLIGFFGCLSIPLGAILWFYLLRDYQKQRVLTFLNPESDPLGSGYHIIQSKIAIGSGGLEGKGWLMGTQSQLEFLPERHTDFIFSVFSEEFGLIGIGLLLAIYMFIIGRGLLIAARSQHPFTKLLAGSLTLTFFVYFFVNIGMVSGLLPVVGVPLPLVSYGGTSMVTLMAGFGILNAIATNKKIYNR